MTERAHCFLAILLWLPILGYSQSETLRYHKKELSEIPAREFRVTTEHPFTAVAFSIQASDSFKSAYLISDNDTFFLVKNEHAPIRNDFMHSNLISFSSSQRSFRYRHSSDSGRIIIHFINGLESPVLPSHLDKSAKGRSCEEPVSIPQEEWRSGLDPPNYVRAFESPKHLIVHHSAGSNSNANYRQVVRDIYVYHTQVNGWSDIGYNYLIAQDGTIFKGRDPDAGEQDDVVGAHFCSKNTGTMGICLLGTYTDIQPTKETLASLVSLLSWKLDKEGLSPSDEFPFSDPPTLGSVVGHRDGCATVCPGQVTYDLLPDIIERVQNTLDACNGKQPLIADYTSSEVQVERGESVSFEDRSLGLPTSWQWIFEGGVPGEDAREIPVPIRYHQSGNYDVTLIVRDDDGNADTLIQEDYIKVRSPDLPRLSPNPILSGDDLLLEVEFPEDVLRVYVYDASGRFVMSMNPLFRETELDTSAFPSGLYFLRVNSRTGDRTIPFSIL